MAIFLVSFWFKEKVRTFAFEELQSVALSFCGFLFYFKFILNWPSQTAADYRVFYPCPMFLTGLELLQMKAEWSNDKKKKDKKKLADTDIKLTSAAQMW